MKHRSRGSQRGGQRRHNNNRPQRDNQPRENQQNFQGRGNGGADMNRGGGRPIVQSILPSPEILQEYEYASEGTVARLLEMAETEQDRRNHWENEYFRFHKKSMRIGQYLGFILLCSVIWGAIYLGSIGESNLGEILAISGFGSVALASLFSEIGRRLSRRPRRGDRR